MKKNTYFVNFVSRTLVVVLCISVGWISSVTASTSSIRLSEPVEISASSETFGSAFPDVSNKVTLRQLMVKADEYIDRQVYVTTNIAKVCQKKGCFFIAQDDGVTMRIAFKDYAFFIPTDSSGKQVDLAGVLTRKYMSDSAAKHFSEDIGGKEGDIKPGVTYEFIANSVRILR